MGGHPFYLTTYVDESCQRRLFANTMLLEIIVIFDDIILKLLDQESFIFHFYQCSSRYFRIQSTARSLISFSS